MPTLGAAANCMDLNLLGNALACGVGTECVALPLLVGVIEGHAKRGGVGGQEFNKGQQ